MTDSRKLLAGLTVVVAITAVVTLLVLAPFHRVYDAAECRDAYGRARSATDTAHVDLRRYAAPSGSANRRCGELRGVSAETAGVLSLR